MADIIVNNKGFNIYIKHDDIIDSIIALSEKMNKDLQRKNPLFVVVLNGAFVFASELITRYKGDCEVSFVRLSSYEGTNSKNIVNELLGLNIDVKDRTVVIVEDIVDTGLTMLVATEKLRSAGAKEVFIATLLFKPNAFKYDYKIHYIGINISNDFIIGFGLDYDGKARNLPDIYKISE